MTVAQQDQRLHLVMAGPAPDDLLAALQSLVQKLGLVERVTFAGMLQGAEKWGAMRAAEAFVLPSHQENFGVAAAEALAMGVPALLSTQVNIWREVVSGGARGVDALGERWAAEKGVPVKRINAEWERYGRAAKRRRNQMMTEYGEALIAVWEEGNRGISKMICEAKRHGLFVFVHRIAIEESLPTMPPPGPPRGVAACSPA